MPGSLSDYAEQLVLNAMFRGTETINNATVYVGLATSTITDSDDLSTIAEEDDADYVRKPISFGAPVDVGDGSHVVSNDEEVQFASYADDGDLTVVSIFVTATETGTAGDILAWMDLVEAKSPKAGEVLTVPVGNLEISLD